MRIVPFEPWHLLQIECQSLQRFNDGAIRSEANAKELGESGPVYTALSGNVPIGIAGVANCGIGRGLAWAVFSPEGIRHFGGIHRAAKRFLAISEYRRLEMIIDPRHAAAQRWAKKLGFEREGLMRSYTPKGEDAELWARVK